MDKRTEGQPPANDNLTRRDLVRAGGLFAAGIAAVMAGVLTESNDHTENDVSGSDSIRAIRVKSTIPVEENADVLLRMQADLEKALAKPMEERKWVMVIDTRKCVGCHACTVACIAENQLPPGVVYRPVLTEEEGEFPNLMMRFMPRPCMQCDNPPCTPVCPVEATWKRKDGIVAIDYDKCIGCRYCVTACPYGARTMDYGEFYSDGTPERQPYEKAANFEYGKRYERTEHGSPVGNARKCQFCVHRLDEGMLPMCVTTCIGRATFFGDANDPDSVIRHMLKQHNQMRLLEEKGTKPQVVYLV